METRKLFGTDGIRGQANQYPMTAEVALALGRGLASLFKKPNRPGRILIGKDTRISGYMFEMAMASGISSMGSEALLIGPMPTPGIAFLTNTMRADAGVVISASHNPYSDNGIKIFDREGFKLPDTQEARLEEIIFSMGSELPKPPPEQMGRVTRVEGARERYIEFLKRTTKDLSLEGLKVVLDCANGAAYQIGPTVLEELGAEVIPISVEPNGLNINDGCGALSPQNLAREVCERRADLGIALDGDADRVLFVDEKGRAVPGDAVLLLCATQLKKAGRLKKETVVSTVMANLGLEEALRRSGIRMVRTSVGDRYIVEKMREEGYCFGGEPSGHLIFLDHATTGDGIVAALQLLTTIVQERKRLSELTTAYQAYPQVLENVRVQSRRDLATIPEVHRKIQEVERSLGREGRLLIRYSGTEPLIRVMVEGRDEVKIRQMAKDLSSCLEKHL